MKWYSLNDGLLLPRYLFDEENEAGGNLSCRPAGKNAGKNKGVN